LSGDEKGKGKGPAKAAAKDPWKEIAGFWCGPAPAFGSVGKSLSSNPYSHISNKLISGRSKVLGIPTTIWAGTESRLPEGKRNSNGQCRAFWPESNELKVEGEMRAERTLPRKLPPPRRDFYSEGALKHHVTGEGAEKLESLSEEEVVRRVEKLALKTGEEIKWHEREMVKLEGGLDGISSRKGGVEEEVYGEAERVGMKRLLPLDLVRLLGL
jgi:hypothetical protein